MKKTIQYVVGLIFLCNHIQAQELFTYTEPASNMAKGTIGIRMTSTLMSITNDASINTHINPELMMGWNKHWMFHVDGFASNRRNGLQWEGGSFYTKYRFYSEDEVHSHFRMAAYGLIGLNKSDMHQLAIDLRGHNSGWEAGIVATKLKHKTAVSASAALVHAWNNTSLNKFPFSNDYRNAIGYTLSIGKLLLPKEYTSYRQTNLNGMVEVLGQYHPAWGKSYLDVAPVLQFIFLSRMRLDLSYRFNLVNDLTRTAPSGGLIRLEYNFFNAF